MKPEEFGHEFREHMQSIWRDIDRAGLITIELRHAQTNLAEALDAFDFAPEPSSINTLRTRFVVYETVAGPSERPTNDG